MLEEHLRPYGYKPALLCYYEGIIYLLEPNYLVVRAKKVEFSKSKLHSQLTFFEEISVSAWSLTNYNYFPR